MTFASEKKLKNINYMCMWI